MINPTCFHCKHELMQPGVVIIGTPITITPPANPPLHPKIHICSKCETDLLRWLGTPFPGTYTQLIPDGFLRFQAGDMYTYWEGNELKPIPENWKGEVVLTSLGNIYWRPICQPNVQPALGEKSDPTAKSETVG